MIRISAPATILIMLAGVLLWATGCAGEPSGPGGSDSPAIAWRTLTSDPRPGRHHPTADGDRLYALVEGLSAYDLDTGARVWRTDPPTGEARNVVVEKGKAFVAADAAAAFDAATGEELWRTQVDDGAVGITAVDERAFYVGSGSGSLRALDLTSGQLLWQVDLLRSSDAPAQVHKVSVSGDTLYVSLLEQTSPTGHLNRGIVVALDRHDGAELWRYANHGTGENHDVNTHTAAGAMLLVSDWRGGGFMGLDRSTGVERWRHVGSPDLFGATDAFEVAGGVAYIASYDTNAYALDPRTGDIRWSTGLEGSASSSTVCGSHLYVARFSLHKLQTEDGAEVGHLFLDQFGAVEDDRFVVSHLLSHDGRVYFVGNDAVYAVECD